MAARDGQRMDRKRIRQMAIPEQRDEGALLHGARDHEIRQPRDAEPGHRHVEQQVGIVGCEGAGYGEPIDAFVGVEGPMRPRQSRQR